MLNTPDEYQRMFEVEEKHWWYRALHNRVLRSIQAKFKSKNIRILDAGCGCGGLLFFLKSSGYQNIQGFDISKNAVEYATKRGLDIAKGDIEHFKTDQKYDVIICNDVLCYLDKTKVGGAINHFMGYLKEGGIFISNNNALDIFWGTNDIAVASKHRFNRHFFKNIFASKAIFTIEGSYWSLGLSPLVLAVRLSSRFRHFVFPKSKYLSDIDLPSPMINKALFTIANGENSIFKNQPFGSSYYFVVSK
jgi:2-polyprenyl-3-methyl-5-hydroxy-6-metoxy-1,4-benzoquinol methylase